MARTFVIGDIHGALKALEQLIGQLLLQPSDRLIFLGDFVDGWSQSSQVIEYLMALQQQYDCILIKGNHDAWCERWLKGEEPDPVWYRNGGKETMASYDAVSPEERWVHLEWYNQLKLYHVDEQNRLFLHAGFASLHGPEKEHYETNFYWDRSLWEMALCMDKRIQKDSVRYPKRLLLYKEIFIGHTPTVNYDVTIPMNACNVWNVDTGAAFMGRISAMDIDTKEYWQSEPAYVFYPGEKGRNK